MFDLNIPIIIDFEKHIINISFESIVNSLKENNESIDKFFEIEIENCIQLAKEHIEPYACYIIKRINEIDTSKGIIFLDNITLNVNQIIARQLKGSNYLAVFISTIGDKIEAISKNKIKNGDFLNGLIYNNIGSEAVENVAKFIHAYIENIARQENYNITNRFSPGYCKWNVEEQKILFSFFPSDINKVKLNNSSLMYPIKSVSGIIGIGKDVQKKHYYCAQCNEKNCIYLNNNLQNLNLIN